MDFQSIALPTELPARKRCSRTNFKYNKQVIKIKPIFASPQKSYTRLKIDQVDKLYIFFTQIFAQIATQIDGQTVDRIHGLL